MKNHINYITELAFNVYIDERFIDVVDVLMSESLDDEIHESLIEESIYNTDNECYILDYERFIIHAIEYSLFNEIEYATERKSYTKAEIMLKTLLELARIFKATFSNDYDVLKTLISYANEIASVVYDELYRN